MKDMLSQQVLFTVRNTRYILFYCASMYKTLMQMTKLPTYAGSMVSNIQKVTFAARIIAAPCIFATAL